MAGNSTERSEVLKSLRNILGEGSSSSESFRSADLDGQTDYDLDTTTSLVENPWKVRRPKSNRENPTQNITLEAKPRRKQKTPVRLQKRTDLRIPKTPFGRLIRETLIRESIYADKVTATALLALQEAAEMYLTNIFQDAYCCTLHRGKVTLNVKDIELTRFIRGVSDPGNR